MSKKFSAKIQKLDALFYENLQGFDEYRYFYPVNFEQEKRAFFHARQRRQTYNPAFTYLDVSDKDRQRIEFLNNLKIPDDEVGRLYTQVKQRFLLTLEMAQNRQAESFTNLAQKRGGIPSSDLLQDAQALLRKYRKQPLENAYFGINVVKDRFQEKLASMQITGWIIQETDNCIWMSDIQPIQKYILLAAGLLVNQKTMDQIIQETLDISIFQQENALKQPLSLFGLGLDRFEETRFGLTIELAHRTGQIQSQILRHYAGGVLASYLGYQYSFAETFQRLSNLFSKERAFLLTTQCKMGLTDTTEKGGLLHTHLPLQGWRKVQPLAAQDLRILYTGRVGVDHLSLLQSWIGDGKIKSPTFLPNILQHVS